MKIRQVGDDWFHADRQIDMKLIVAFRSFANAPKNVIFMPMVDVPLKRRFNPTRLYGVTFIFIPLGLGTSLNKVGHS